jgi:UDP-glucose:glycoprotein glucosyltransferase
MRLGNIIWVNGRFIGPLDANALSLLDIIREERHRAVSLCSMGLTPQQSFEILSDDRIGDALSTADPMDSLVDASDRWEGGKVIQWWNNIEKDSRYAKLPESISAVLTPQRPGSFQPARKNLWNVVLVMDLSTRTGLQTISQTIPNIIRRGIPFRVGLVPSFSSAPSSPGSVMARLIQHMIKQYGRGETIDFISSLLHASNSPTVDLRQAQALFDSAYASSERGSGQRYQDIVQGQQGYDYVEKVQKWLTRLAVNQETSSGHVFFNGQYHPLSDMWFQQVIEDHSSQLAYLQKPAIAKLARKAKDISSFFYDLPTTSRRRNMYITPGVGKNRLRVFDIHDTFPEASPLVKHYVYPSKQASSKSLLSVLVIADLDTYAGWQLVKGLLQHISEHPESEIRVGFQHVPSHEATDDPQFRLSTLVYRLYITGGLSLVDAEDLLATGALLENPENLDLTKQIAKVMPQLSPDSVLRDLLAAEADDLTLAASREFWSTFASGRQVMGIEAGRRYLHVNGRLIGPLEADAFAAEDYASLERYELNTRAKPVFAALNRFYQDIEVLDR